MRIFNYNSNRFLSLAVTYPIKYDVKVDTPEPAKQLLDMIYSADPETGLPVGDLAIFLGENANPQVKDFIQKTLLQDVTPKSDGVSIPQDVLNRVSEVITDDDISFFSRAHGESSNDYAARMNKYFDHQRVINQEKKKLSELKKIMAASAKL